MAFQYSFLKQAVQSDWKECFFMFLRSSLECQNKISLSQTRNTKAMFQVRSFYFLNRSLL